MTDVLQQEIAQPVKVTLAGKDWELTLPTSAVIRYKQKTGDNLFNANHCKHIDDDPEKLIAVLWVASQEKQQGTTFDQVEALVNVGTAPLVTAAIIKLL